MAKLVGGNLATGGWQVMVQENCKSVFDLTFQISYTLPNRVFIRSAMSGVTGFGSTIV